MFARTNLDQRRKYNRLIIPYCIQYIRLYFGFIRWLAIVEECYAHGENKKLDIIVNILSLSIIFYFNDNKKNII